MIDVEGISPEDAFAKVEVRKHLLVALDMLGPRHAKAAHLRFGLDDGIERGYAEIGAQMKVSRSYARQMVETVLSEIRFKKVLSEEGDLRVPLVAPLTFTEAYKAYVALKKAHRAIEKAHRDQEEQLFDQITKV